MGTPPPPRGSPLQNYTWLINMLYKIYINQTEGCVTRSVRASSGRTARAPPGRPLPSTSRAGRHPARRTAGARSDPCAPVRAPDITNRAAPRARGGAASRPLPAGRERGEGPPRAVHAAPGRGGHCGVHPAQWWALPTRQWCLLDSSGGHCLLDASILDSGGHCGVHPGMGDGVLRGGAGSRRSPDSEHT